MIASQYPYLMQRKHQADVGRFIDHILGKTTLSAPPPIEFSIDDPVMRTILRQFYNRKWVSPGDDHDSQAAYLNNVIFFWQSMGYDLIRFERALPFPGLSLHAKNTVAGAHNDRSWVNESGGLITSWEEFEKYPFPKVEEFDFFCFEYLNSQLPEGMGLALAHGGGIFERVSWIFSLEKLCFLLIDQPDLVQAVIERVAELQLSFYRQILDFDRLVAIFPGDDMGFRTATLISPAHLRTYFLPWHVRISEMAQKRGVPYFLHSCGNLEKIMPDLIENVKIAGKHSYEDAIIPVEDFYQRYHDRIAILGGIDVHFLATATSRQVRRKVRDVIQACAQGNRYALGSGNSIPDYVPVENYLAMLDELWAIHEE